VYKKHKNMFTVWDTISLRNGLIYWQKCVLLHLGIVQLLWNRTILCASWFRAKKQIWSSSYPTIMSVQTLKNHGFIQCHVKHLCTYYKNDCTDSTKIIKLSFQQFRITLNSGDIKRSQRLCFP
jgi:hypothetical protein